MKDKNRRRRRPDPSLDAMLLEAARRPLPTSDHAGDDDCPLCRMTAEQTPIEIITLPDGTVIEMHEMPAPDRECQRTDPPRGRA